AAQKRKTWMPGTRPGMTEERLHGASQRLQILQQLPALVIAELVRSVRRAVMPGVRIPRERRVEQRRALRLRGLEAHHHRIELAAADMELLVALVGGQKQLPQVRDRAVVQVGRGRPETVERAAPVGVRLS